MTPDNSLETANDYSLYSNVNLPDKLKPVHGFIDQLLIRLEEFKILLEVAKRNQTSPADISLLVSYRNEFDKLCDRIDKVEELMDHIQSNLNKLEEDIVKTEIDLGFGDSTIKVPNILSPLFRKVDKKTKADSNSRPLNTQDYFIESIDEQ